ncbi:hypothetical protein D3C74_213140 [compost metagenome]
MDLTHFVHRDAEIRYPVLAAAGAEIRRGRYLVERRDRAGPEGLAADDHPWGNAVPIRDRARSGGICAAVFCPTDHGTDLIRFTQQAVCPPAAVIASVLPEYEGGGDHLPLHQRCRADEEHRRSRHDECLARHVYPGVCAWLYVLFEPVADACGDCDFPIVRDRCESAVQALEEADQRPLRGTCRDSGLFARTHSGHLGHPQLCLGTA